MNPLASPRCAGIQLNIQLCIQLWIQKGQNTVTPYLVLVLLPPCAPIMVGALLSCIREFPTLWCAFFMLWSNIAEILFKLISLRFLSNTAADAFALVIFQYYLGVSFALVLCEGLFRLKSTHPGLQGAQMLLWLDGSSRR